MKNKMVEDGRCTFHLSQEVKSINLIENKVHLKTLENDDNLVFDHAISSIDGEALKEIITSSQGLEDKDAIMSSLETCKYGDMASCSLVYGGNEGIGEMVYKSISKEFPESMMHIVLVQEEEQDMKIIQVMNMTNFMPK